MADLTPINGATEALAALPSQFVGKPNAEALWQALASPVTDYETTLQWLQTAYSLSAGTGVQLDAIGQIVGQPRAGGPYPVGESDADYLRKLRAAIIRNHSNGTIEDMIGVVNALLSNKAPVTQVFEVPPAGFVLAVWVSSALSALEVQALIDFCEDSRAAGVGIVGLAYYTDPTFAWGNVTTPAPFKGFDDGTTAVGGSWANYIWP